MARAQCDVTSLGLSARARSWQTKASSSRSSPINTVPSPVRLCPFGLEHDRAEIGRLASALRLALASAAPRSMCPAANAGSSATAVRPLSIAASSDQDRSRPGRYCCGTWPGLGAKQSRGDSRTLLPPAAPRLSHIPQIEMGIGKFGLWRMAG